MNRAIATHATPSYPHTLHYTGRRRARGRPGEEEEEEGQEGEEGVSTLSVPVCGKPNRKIIASHCSLLQPPPTGGVWAAKVEKEGLEFRSPPIPSRLPPPPPHPLPSFITASQTHLGRLVDPPPLPHKHTHTHTPRMALLPQAPPSHPVSPSSPPQTITRYQVLALLRAGLSALFAIMLPSEARAAAASAERKCEVQLLPNPDSGHQKSEETGASPCFRTRLHTAHPIPTSPTHKPLAPLRFLSIVALKKHRARTEDVNK